jgi:hypothetical protein
MAYTVDFLHRAVTFRGYGLKPTGRWSEHKLLMPAVSERQTNGGVNGVLQQRATRSDSHISGETTTSFTVNTVECNGCRGSNPSSPSQGPLPHLTVYALGRVASSWAQTSLPLRSRDM